MTLRTLSLSLLVAACAADPVPGDLRIGTACPTAVMAEVNDAWIADHEEPGDDAWARAVYFIGNTAAYETLGDPAYLAYALRWAERHDWKLHRGTTTRNADDHAAGQTYLALYDRDPARIADLAASIDNLIDSGERDDWSWIDAFFMASPVLAELGAISGHPRYAKAMVAMYRDAKQRRALFDDASGLWFRDESYRHPDATTASGKKVFWSRGNGWVIGSIVRTLAHLPGESPYRAEYEEMLQTMAAALVPLQRADGFWNASLHDPVDHGGPETSGTAFFAYALAWGIRHGVLDRATYLPAAVRAWHALVAGAVLEDGTVGYIQGVGEEPASAQPVTLGSTADFGVGAFLLAGSEMAQLDVDLGCAARSLP